MPGEFPGINTDQYFATDSNINVFVGGDYLADGGAAETEGTLVVAGSATFNSGFFNIGTVGVGSGIVPEVDSDMLIVGGDIVLVGESELDVGHPVGAFAGGGNVVAGGQITGEDSIETNGGSISSGVDNALGNYAGFADELAEFSADLTEEAGTAGFLDGSRLILEGDGSDNLQVFTVSADDVASASSVGFINFGDSAPILINVIGENVNATFNDFSVYESLADTAGDRIDNVTAGTVIGNAAARILWNFADATDVTIGGTSQFVGSILVPAAESATDVTASTNGRLFVGGDLTTRGNGNEQHAYPWSGSPLTDCTPREENSETPEEEPETPDEGEETETPDEGDEPEVPGEEEPEAPVEEEDETPVTEEEAPQVEDEVVVEETEAPVVDDATNTADEESLPVTGANIGLVLPLAALLLVLIGGGLALIARTRSRA
ncbi:choice-of-anchor A family protein [Paramicrobacterium sp. CJ85]|uniref:choice-of-anchor A family protein n=1 Tax=Paramicrobacterium sp. CJ85 TaxID=3445355 RepID=UPI003F60CEB8